MESIVGGSIVGGSIVGGSIVGGSIVAHIIPLPSKHCPVASLHVHCNSHSLHSIAHDTSLSRENECGK